MANVEQGLRRLCKHRYTIQQLLTLSGNAYSSFDLSKFSFDAARAGVVPSLGDCATTSRKSSASRPRFSSTESTSFSDDPMGPTSLTVQAPERCANPPPGSVLAQNHSGFARFLKKHSSPTHQRVTAGGRIVPMEQQTAPPPFALSINKYNNLKAPGKTPGQKEGVPQQSPSIITNVSPRSEAKITVNSQTPNLLANSKFNTPLNGATLPVNVPWQSHLSDVPPSNPITSINGISHCSMMTSVEGIPTPYTGTMHMGPMMHSMWQPMYTSPTSIPYPWSYCDPAVSLMPPNQASVPSYLAQPIVWAQNALSEWSQRYNELDQQLKALDRHRAMTNLTADIAHQRREIVQQRADSKNMINSISNWLNLSDQAQSGFNQPVMSSQFNADAVIYVPVGQPVSLPAPTVTPNNTPKAVQNSDIQKPPMRSVRRPIAIVPPPEARSGNLPSSEKDKSVSVSRKHDDAGAWGVKTDPASPGVQEKQSQITAPTDFAAHQSLCSSQSEESLISAPKGGFFPHDKPIAEQNELGGEGLDIAEPVTAFEKTQTALSRPELTVSHARISEDKKENVTAGSTAHRKAATDASPLRSSGSEVLAETRASICETRSLQDHSNLSRFENQKLQRNGDVVLRYDKIRGSRLRNRNIFTVHDNSLQTTFLSAGTTDIALQRNKQDSLNDTSTAVSTDIITNKGHSLTSVQNINAVAQLPPPLDGAQDNGRSSKSLFSLVGKMASPRRL